MGEYVFRERVGEVERTLEFATHKELMEYASSVQPSEPEPEEQPVGEVDVDTITLDVPQCQRCLGEHKGLVFYELLHPSEGFTAWAACPNTGHPILMKIPVQP